MIVFLANLDNPNRHLIQELHQTRIGLLIEVFNLFQLTNFIGFFLINKEEHQDQEGYKGGHETGGWLRKKAVQDSDDAK